MNHVSILRGYARPRVDSSCALCVGCLCPCSTWLEGVWVELSLSWLEFSLSLLDSELLVIMSMQPLG